MKSFRYTAIDAAGNRSKGKIRAESRSAAMSQLAGKFHAVTELEESGFSVPQLKIVWALLGFMLLCGAVVAVVPAVVARQAVARQAATDELSRALLAGNLEEVSRRLNQRPELVKEPLRDGRYPLHLAVEAARPELIKFLLDSGAEVTTPDSLGVTPLHLAATAAPEILEPMLNSAATVPDSRGNTPLHYAAAAAATDNIKALLGKVDLNQVNEAGETPLMAAVGSDSLSAIDVLLQAGSHLEITDSEGNSALHHAAESGSVEVVRLLLKSGANRQAKNADEQTPADLAKAVGFEQLAKILQ